MASQAKRAHLEPTSPETPDNTESSSDVGESPTDDDLDDDDDDEEEDDDEDGLDESEREIQVEFEARTPEDKDLPGIIGLLKQCLRGSSEVDATTLAQLIVRQRSVGSVVTQSHNDDDESEEEDDFADGEVFGLATVIRLRGNESAEQIVRYLNRAAKDPSGSLGNLLSEPNSDLGLIISERIINMPPQIAVPLYQTLQNEIRKAKAKLLPFDFTHFALISKILVPENNSNSNGGISMYTNAEEEVFVGECDLVIELDSGKKDDDDNDRKLVTLSQEDFIEKKKLLVFKADKLDKIVSIVKHSFPIS